MNDTVDSLTTTMSKARKISDNILEMSERISQRLTMDTNTGVADIGDNAFIDMLPEGITKEIVETVYAHTMDMASGALHSLGEAAIPAFINNANLNSVTLSFPIVGKDKIDIEIVRSKDTSYENSSGEKVVGVKYCSSNVKIDQYGLGKRGEMFKIKNLLSAQAEEALSKL